MNGGWVSSVLQAPSTQLRASRQRARHSTGSICKLCFRLLCSRDVIAAAGHARATSGHVLISTRVSQAVQRGLPSRSFSSGANQLIKVMVKESVAYTKAARQRCNTACARLRARLTACECCIAEHCCTPTAWRMPPPRTCSHLSSSLLMRSRSCWCTAARWAAGWVSRQRPWSRWASTAACSRCQCMYMHDAHKARHWMEQPLLS